MTCHAEKLVHEPIGLTQSQFTCARLRPFVQQALAFNDERSQPGNGFGQCDLLSAVFVFRSAIIQCQSADQLITHEHRCYEHGTYAVGIGLTIEGGPHHIENQHLVFAQASYMVRIRAIAHASILLLGIPPLALLFRCESDDNEWMQHVRFRVQRDNTHVSTTQNAANQFGQAPRSFSCHRQHILSHYRNRLLLCEVSIIGHLHKRLGHLQQGI